MAREEGLLEFHPVAFEAGVDCHEGDLIGSIEGIDEAFLRERDRFVIGEVVARRIPVVINLAGGYEGYSKRLHVQTARVAAEAMSYFRTHSR